MSGIALEQASAFLAAASVTPIAGALGQAHLEEQLGRVRQSGRTAAGRGRSRRSTSDEQRRRWRRRRSSRRRRRTSAISAAQRAIDARVVDRVRIGVAPLRGQIWRKAA